jgi:hypothetical protein
MDLILFSFYRREKWNKIIIREIEIVKWKISGGLENGAAGIRRRRKTRIN